MSKAAVRYSGNVAIVDLAGRIVLGDGSGLIRNTIKDLLNAGHKNILLNLQEVKYIDSFGLGEMAELLRHRVQHGRQDQVPECALQGLATCFR